MKATLASADGNSRERLIYMHGVELFTIGGEADDVVVHENLANLFSQAFALHFKSTQYTVTA